MFTDSFYLAAYWSQRNEKLGEVVEKTVDFLQNLTDLNVEFNTWFELGNSVKEALKYKVSIDADSIESLYIKNLKKKDLDINGFSKIGFSLSIWSGHIEGLSSSLSINCGHSSKYFSNTCLIKFPYEGVKRVELLGLVRQKQLFQILIEGWNPDSIILSSSKLKTEIDTDEIGWITFFKNLKREPKKLNNLIHENFHSGHLFYLNSDSIYDFNLANDLLALKKCK